MNKLLALADRVEKLTGPDRETDWRIQEALGIGKWPAIDIWPPFMKGSKVDKSIPAYTASIDAAMTLVPAEAAHHFVEQQKVFRRSADYSWARLSLVFDDGFSVGDEGRAATPALALTSASLRARAHGGGEG